MSLNEILSFASSSCKLHPAETLVFYLQPDYPQIHAGEPIQITFPHGLRIENYRIEGQEESHENIWVVDQNGATVLRWVIGDDHPETRGFLTINATVDKNAPQGYLVCVAEILNSDDVATFQVNHRILVNRLANSLRFLPEIYYNDDFLNRFLMLIDSFWQPISQQIDQVPNYADPSLAPERFVHWMGEWFGMDLEKELPEELKRKIVAKIGPVLATKGTKQAMFQLLRLYSGGKVEITEHMDSDFVIGSSTQLGYQIALGKKNKPNSFDVVVEVPTPKSNEEKDPFYVALFRKKIESIIEMCKPAHTFYQLEIKFVDR